MFHMPRKISRDLLAIDSLTLVQKVFLQAATLGLCRAVGAVLKVKIPNVSKFRVSHSLYLDYIRLDSTCSGPGGE